MENYLIYVGVAIATILLPGPAVMLTLNNSIQRGILKSLAGILGIALAILLVAIISATSLGIVLASSAIAFNIIKIVGAAYLIYLGIKMFRSEAANNNLFKKQEGSFFKCFMEGFLVSVSNPKAVIFFMSIFPQFIDLTQEYTPQFILLAVTFSFLVIVIHTIYAVSASFAKSKLSSQKGSSLLNKISGGVFVSFGVGLAASSK
ncbi:LysE family translocator [Neptunomonas phycophila]|uniref:LysE family translocator n=1 Tax=Neptunomonas phycophila TaxID=1572645 RepID=UPI000948F4D5|nr:LysE family translocator [Neptunomonas phycophila]